MATMTVNSARITACAVVLGEHEHDITDEPYNYNNDPALLARLKRTIGFDRRYTASVNTTTCDLCRQAALRLFPTMGDIKDVGAIVSVTQTPDYLMPGNAHLLHASLGLDKSALAFDLELGCSGYVYGLNLAAMLAEHGIGKVLLLAGDTLSKKVNVSDRATAPLFGDAGSATLVEYAPGADAMHFLLCADGGGVPKMLIPAGGCRAPSTELTRQSMSLTDGVARSKEDIYMDGFGIFEFTMTEQPEALRAILEYSQKELSDIDYFIFHQANRYIVRTITRKAGIPEEKAPSDIFSRYGNLNAASIPGALCGALAKPLAASKVQVILQGFGIGLSWGACRLELDHVRCFEPELFVGGNNE